MAAVAFVTVGHAQQSGSTIDCGDLFISEYLEGSGNNKALEIYNPTNSPVSLGNYRLVRYDNGSSQSVAEANPASILPLPSNITLAPKAVYVIALNLTDPNGTGQTQPIDPALQALADTLLCDGCGTEPGNIRVMCFNGDDALGLQKNVDGAWVFTDVFGSIGERPTNSQGSWSPTAGWTDLAPFSSMPPGYTSPPPYFMRYWTLDQTLIRKPSVKQGVSANPQPETFNPSIQWDSLAVNTFTNLGSHTCECNELSISNVNDRTLVMFPNPSSKFVTISTSKPVAFIELFNLTGQSILRQTENNNLNTQIDISGLPAGSYTVHVKWNDGKTTVRSLIKN